MKATYKRILICIRKYMAFVVLSLIAAAVTVIEVDKCMALPVFDDPVVIRLDRPFVYAIVDTETGTPIFLGCQNSIK